MAFSDLFVVNYTYCLLVLIAILFLFLKKNYQQSNRNYPPGPKGLPLLGYLPFITGQQDAIMNKLHKEYGDIVMFPVGSENVVVFNTLEAIKESFVKQGDTFAGKRNSFKVLDHAMDFRGIFCEEGKQYKDQRKFVINSLREFGVGKISLEDSILTECDALVKELRKIEGVPFYPTPLLEKTVINILCGYINGMRYEYDDPKLLKVADLFERLDINFSQTYAVDFFPWFRRFLPYSLQGIKLAEGIKEEMMEYLDDVIEKHKRTFDDKNIKDFTDSYIYQIRQQKDMGAFDYVSLRSNMLAMFIAGTISTSMTLSWALKLLVDNQQVQQRLIREIDSVIGRERHPSWLDRSAMIYTEATLHEVQRYADLVPIGVPHTSTENTKVLGFDIPKRSYVYGNFKRLHSDPAIWGDPDNFRPERFIDASSGKLINTENIFVFGVGRRRCVGEALARMNMFDVLITLLQNFTFHPLKDSKDQGVTGGLIRYLLPYEIVAKPRK